ncbi:hypothetical protein FD967_00700 [Polynucleobacter sp. JS-Mosq-20-D10]|uniref:hypothetical protein n=1 Tax=Polynucleobacter sp. JS-Mosq-20-D10 TaxID=2576922 RepID=UPI001BFD2568|nr:hypothetical protein [Polynucleobacter sp. JS-Mosq-20-D10]QWE00600.1 hypothetical protein FD967_00700 [Polynucleobacter sp. JS-Mosq-20-D10]
MKIGLIQSRGLGDIIIALPIARHFYESGDEVFWPINESFLPSFQEATPWVNWIGIGWSDPINFDYMYQVPMDILHKVSVNKVLSLYHYLSTHKDLPNKLLQSTLKFDQYKYAVSNVPFSKKWTLANCLKRNIDRESNLFDKLVKQEKYMVIHQQGSDFSKKFNVDDAKNKGYQIIEISEVTDNIFDWLKVLENAKALVLIDSVFSNLVEQLGIGENVPKYFGVRSDAMFTPVLLGNWQYI